MKLSGFLVGGLIGAAATVYVSRKRPGAIAWAASALSDISSNVVGKSVSMMMNKNWKQEAADMTPKHIDGSAVKSEAAWGQIEAIVNSDPDLKREAEKIKAESSALAH
ncbi:hypothetical protein [Paenibacillus prosopidis]|uniref:Uncharacterized protein n=1 Tax=Paenibacillus prosopidis TaxID=630520 RepID=A0A368W732_9BACL|nr:hypothetical protein [Paenibacillus prosopidis]RCW51142.1 hypothetical protein DFP97_102336 [Paenibacillus prosopidis]